MKGRQLSFRSQFNICRHEIAGNCLDALGMCSRRSADENHGVTCPAPSAWQWECQYYRRSMCWSKGGTCSKADPGKEEKTVDLGMDGQPLVLCPQPLYSWSFCTSFCPDFQQVFCGELKSLAQVVSAISMLFNNRNICIYTHIYNMYT